MAATRRRAVTAEGQLIATSPTFAQGRSGQGRARPQLFAAGSPLGKGSCVEVNIEHCDARLTCSRRRPSCLSAFGSAQSGHGR